MNTSREATQNVDYYLGLDYPVELSRWTEDDENYWVAAVTDLPGCIADGATPDEAVEAIQEAKRLWIEARLEGGYAVPEPTETRDYSGRLLLRLPKSLHRTLTRQAKREGMSLNAYLVSHLSQQAPTATDLSKLRQEVEDLRAQLQRTSANILQTR